jgi:hypothetical protein
LGQLGVVVISPYRPSGPLRTGSFDDAASYADAEMMGETCSPPWNSLWLGQRKYREELQNKYDARRP